MVDRETTPSSVVPRRPLLGRRATCQYYSPSWILSRNDEKRLLIVQEILETEEKYIKCLETIRDVFEDRLRRLRIIPTKDVDVIFPPSLSEILTSHIRLHETLSQRIQEWNYRSTFGDLFVRFFSQDEQGDLVQKYSEFSNNFPKAIRTIHKWRLSSHKFDNFLETCRANWPCNGLDLQAYLLNPIQRLPRYVLLISQLVKFTDVSHPDRVHVEQAFTTLTRSVDELNSSIQNSLKLVSETMARKRFPKRRPVLKQKELIRVYHNDEGGERAKDIKTRPVSICSSNSSGYASDEGDSGQTAQSTINNKFRPMAAPNDSVQIRDSDCGLREIAQQKFDFANSCTSPSLLKLQTLKQTGGRIPENKDSLGRDRRDSCGTKELRDLRDAIRRCGVTDSPTVPDDKGKRNAKGRPMSMFVGSFFSANKDKQQSINNNNNVGDDSGGFPALNIGPCLEKKSIKRAYSDGLSSGFLPQTLDFAGQSGPRAGLCGKRMSWTPQNSCESLPGGRCGLYSGSQSSFRSGYTKESIDEDRVSVGSGFSTVSMPVSGRYTKKKMSLRELFKQLRPGKQRGSAHISVKTCPPPQEPRSRLVRGMQMISAV
ncbi:predicted protein [Nematostella vectensis]|uniref:DH domain-containing protein n=1 Tax=Nematostella vectensis TaxID=45351 RepID=A7SXH1_NEMVE|nr:predicted protein [Nematostella vectensis]|eukprot:XP_001623687.1 predicted protein [Nematostella vectensis]